MGFRSVVIALALVGCLNATVFAEGSKNQIVEPQSPGEEMSGSVISDLSFRNESLFLIRADTGMSPNVPAKGVRTPVAAIQGLGIAPAAGSWSFTLTDTATRYLSLDLYQTVDAVFGSGELMDRGTTAQVTAGGTVLGDRLSLYVTPIGTQNLYRFSLTIKPGSMDGDYIFTAPGITQPGVAFGSLVAPQGAAGQNQ
ncbi:MAG: hypothetical protein NTV25_06565 [Methanothrix sp.]|nr:hypothetical protein [Methanothrix sp.]